LIFPVTVLIIISAVAGVYYYIRLSTPTQSPMPKGLRYLTYYPSHIAHGGNETKVLLLASNLRYGVYDHDFRQLLCEHEIKKGDPCVIANVTIRNDYAEELVQGYFISLTVCLYNTEGKQVQAPIMTYGQLHCGMVEVNLRRGETTTFDIHVAYEKQDIDNYEIYIFNILDAPTP